MNSSRRQISTPAAALRALIGEGSINPAAFRRRRIERFWPCGCLSDHAFDNGDAVRWTPCLMHEPAPAAAETAWE
jgi:hypothetical protein